MICFSILIHTRALCHLEYHNQELGLWNQTTWVQVQLYHQPECDFGQVSYPLATSVTSFLDQARDGNTLIVSPDYVISLLCCDHVFMALDFEPKKGEAPKLKMGRSYV